MTPTTLTVRSFDDRPDRPRSVTLELDRKGDLVLYAEPTTSIAIKGFEIPAIAHWLLDQKVKAKKKPRG
jgi:hypothetical protein